MTIRIILLLAALAGAPPQLTAATAPVLVADEGVPEHLTYLTDRLQQEQYAAIDALLDSLALGQREYLLSKLLATLEQQPAPASADQLVWVRAQSARVPGWLVEKEKSGFLVQQPAYDFAAQARLLLSRWQQQAWQEEYRQQLALGRFQFKSIYYRANPELAQQQQALLQALEQLPLPVWLREARQLASQNIYLPDNRLLLQLLQRTGEPGLYARLWRQPVDQDALAALPTINRFHQGVVASRLLIEASANPQLKGAALHQLGTLSPLPEQARSYLLAELTNRQYGAQVVALLLEVDEPLMLSALAKHLGRHDMPPIAPSLLPDSGTPGVTPGL
ncbi:hypothetical protein [Aeromonas enteropelogenes]|uniref:hypothetical protein n=1 Tax=Aeromonas enteropelogenes TaxID=29489 RepID=UPI000F54A1B6|nr:hypothetical protein [Aeromonas enteropelogenes]RQM68000.1 hypothetical protein EHZ64_05440 [Aeromonas enteropelogenes]